MKAEKNNNKLDPEEAKMATAINQAVVESVLEKLSSLRKTLSDEEQEVLDGFIMIPPSEVNLHIVPTDWSGKVTESMGFEVVYSPEKDSYVALPVGRVAGGT